VAAVGDIDGDGKTDIAVSVPMREFGYSYPPKDAADGSICSGELSSMRATPWTSQQQMS
jgi:hypothetical protein